MCSFFFIFRDWGVIVCDFHPILFCSPPFFFFFPFFLKLLPVYVLYFSFMYFFSPFSPHTLLSVLFFFLLSNDKHIIIVGSVCVHKWKKWFFVHPQSHTHCWEEKKGFVRVFSYNYCINVCFLSRGDLFFNDPSNITVCPWWFEYNSKLYIIFFPVRQRG